MHWLLHIGTTKTGSKAIQQFLASETELLTARRIVYLTTGRSGIWHEDLFNSVENGRTDLLAAARKEALSAGADCAVLSYEGLYQLERESIQRLRHTLGAAHILLLIRRQDAHANSWYNQLIKAHRVSISEIEAFEKSATSYDVTFDHSATIERWSSVFGREALHVVTYDKARSSVDALLDTLGIRRSEVRPVARNVNPALTPEMASTLRGIKALLGNSPDLPQVVERFHRRYESSFVDTYGGDVVYLLNPTACAAIMSHYAESNERVRRSWFPERHTLFGPLPRGQQGTLDAAEGMERAARFLRETVPGTLAITERR